MALKDDTKKIFSDLLGPEVAKQLDSFDNPKKYPKDFLGQSLFFLGKFIGEEQAKNKFRPLYKKYFRIALT